MVADNAGFLLTLLIFLPILGAVALFAVRMTDETIRRVSLAVTGLEAVLSLPLWFGFDRTSHAMQFVERQTWIPSFDIQYALGVDGISVLFVLLTAILSPLCVLVSWHSVTSRVREFMVSLLILEGAMIGVFCALDFVLFYVFWEAMLIPMYLLIGVWGGPNRIYATIKFFLYTLAGSLLLLVAIIVLYTNGGGTSDILFLMDQPVPSSIQFWVFWAFFLAFAIKVPMFPFHTWLPDAHVEAPTAGSVFLASVLLKMGAYGFLRFCLPMAPESSTGFAGMILALSVVAILYGAYMALAQTDLKKLIAYSSVSHMGFVTMGIFVMNVQSVEGSILQMVNHGITTGALFILVGMIYDRTHSRQIADYGGIAAPMPRFATMLVIFALSSLGLPGTNGFVGEFFILLGTFLEYPFVAAAAALGVILAAVYLLFMVRRVAFGPITKIENTRLVDLGVREMAILVPLVVLVFWIGVYPDPVLSILHPSVEHLMAQIHSAGAAPVAVGSVLPETP